MYRYRLSRMLGLLLPVLIILGGVGISHAQNRVQINGYNFDLKEGEPSVPAVLDTADEQEPDKGPPENGRHKKRSDRKWIVQFDGPVHEADKKQLAELGARIGDYVPDFAFIVSMDNKTTNEVKKLPFVSGVVRYKPAYKIHQNLKDESGELKVQKGKKVKLHIKLDSKENQSQVLSIVHGKKGKILDVSGDLLRVEVNQEDIAQLAQIEEVLSVEEATDLQLLNDTSKWVIQTYTSNNTKIWDHGLHGEGQIVGISDSGIDYDMPGSVIRQVQPSDLCTGRSSVTIRPTAMITIPTPVMEPMWPALWVATVPQSTALQTLTAWLPNPSFFSRISAPVKQGMSTHLQTWVSCS